MKFSEVEAIVRAYDDALWSPTRMHVQLGCGCGCGGDRYTLESWNAEEQAADEAIEAAKKFCQDLGIEYDGGE